MAGINDPAYAHSCWQDYARVLEQHCAAIIFTAPCSATFHLWQLFTIAIQKDKPSEKVFLDTLADLTQWVQAQNHTVKKARRALDLLGGNPAY